MGDGCVTTSAAWLGVRKGVPNPQPDGNNNMFEEPCASVSAWCTYIIFFHILFNISWRLEVGGCVQFISMRKPKPNKKISEFLSSFFLKQTPNPPTTNRRHRSHTYQQPCSSSSSLWVRSRRKLPPQPCVIICAEGATLSATSRCGTRRPTRMDTVFPFTFLSHGSIPCSDKVRPNFVTPSLPPFSL